MTQGARDGGASVPDKKTLTTETQRAQRKTFLLLNAPLAFLTNLKLCALCVSVVNYFYFFNQPSNQLPAASETLPLYYPATSQVSTSCLLRHRSPPQH